MAGLQGPVGPTGPAGADAAEALVPLTYAPETAAIWPKSAQWLGFGPIAQMALSTTGALVHLTLSLRASQVDTTARFNLCHGPSAAGPWTPIKDLATGSDNLVLASLSTTAIHSVALAGLVKASAAGNYYVGACYRSPESIEVYAGLGYALLLH